MKYIRASHAQIELPKEIEGLEGREVFDREGEKLGHVIDLLIDESHQERIFLELETGGFLGLGRKHLLAPLRGDQVTNETITVDCAKEELHGAPDHDPSVPFSEEYESALAGYWNLPYHWTKPPAVRDPFTERPGELHSMRPEQFDEDPHQPHDEPRIDTRRDQRKG